MPCFLQAIPDRAQAVAEFEGDIIPTVLRLVSEVCLASHGISTELDSSDLQLIVLPLTESILGKARPFF
jgi:hypothetical protein